MAMFSRSRDVWAVLTVVCLVATSISLAILAFHHYSPHRPPKTVLVTGAAGFVGFHVARTLAKDSHNVIVGLDNFNDYYDVQLKIDRGHELHKLGVEILKADICDTHFLQQLFHKHNFTHVVHLAAQAGVRYSLDHPLTYVHSNIEGTQAVLDVLGKYPDVHLVYASSSSVYGKNNPIPFRINANTDEPGNMYAASKRVNELMAYHHCIHTGMKAIGLRFFTVYGPWGRPDMAVYKFADAIMHGKKVPMFNASGGAELGRDFTYVDDITQGILAAMDHRTERCDDVFNLGYGQHVSLTGLVHALQHELNTPADIDSLPLPPTEIRQTWADIDYSTKNLNFKPSTDLRTGVREFVSWFKKYLRNRKESESSGSQPASQMWYHSLITT